VIAPDFALSRGEIVGYPELPIKDVYEASIAAAVAVRNVMLSRSKNIPRLVGGVVEISLEHDQNATIKDLFCEVQ
jgi:hypothetical protein